MAGDFDASLIVGALVEFDESQVTTEVGKMAQVAERSFKVNIKGLTVDTGEGATGGGAGGKKGGGGLLGGIGGKLLGLIGPIGIVLSIISQMRPLMKLIGMITKALTAILEPVQLVLITLLMPILSLLKPIITMVRTLMAPFRKVAMQLAAAGSKAIAGGDIAQGIELIMLSITTLITPAVVVLTGEVIRLAVNSMISGVKFILSAVVGLFSPLLEFFGVNVEEIQSSLDGVFNDISDKVNGAITSLEIGTLTGLASEIQKGIDSFVSRNQSLAENLGVDEIDLEKEVESFYKNIKGELKTQGTLLDLSDYRDKLGESVSSWTEDSLNFVDTTNFTTKLSEKIGKAIEDAVEKASARSGGGGFFGTVSRFAKSIQEGSQKANAALGNARIIKG